MLFMPTNPDLNSSLNHTSLVNTDEGYKLHLYYGLLEKKPEQTNKRLFTYDIDIYTVNRKINIETLLTEFEKINTEMYNIFIWGMNPDLITRLERDLDV